MLESRIHVGDYLKFFVMLERKFFYTCKVLKDRRYETLLKDLKKLEIWGRSLIFRRGVGTKNDKGSRCRMKTKDITRIYLREVSDIGSKTMLQI